MLFFISILWQACICIYVNIFLYYAPFRIINIHASRKFQQSTKVVDFIYLFRIPLVQLAHLYSLELKKIEMHYFSARDLMHVN